MFWPGQAFKDLLACLAVFGVLLYVVIFGGQGHVQNPEPGAATAERSWFDRMAYAGKDGAGANLDAPADPQEQYPARPEWYFLFLFQLLKYFEGDQILIGTVVIPNAVAVILFLLPLFGFGRMRPLGHVIGVVVVVAVLTAAASLTCLAIADDTADPIARKLLEHIAFFHMPALAGILLLQLALLAILPAGVFRKAVFAGGAAVLTVVAVGTAAGLYFAITDAIPEQFQPRLASLVEETAANPSEKTNKSQGFHKQVQHAEENAARAVQLAQSGIPDGGGALLLQRDPMTAGKKLFGPNCGSCHRFAGVSEAGPFHASDLTHFASKEWIRGLLENPSDPQYFGHTKLEGMKGWSAKHHDFRKAMQDEMVELGKKDDEASKKSAAEAKGQLAYYDAWLNRVTAWLATHPTGKPKENPKTPEEIDFKSGYDAFYDKKIKQGRCSTCHIYSEKGGSEGPDLTGYSSADWIRLMIVAPAHPMRHGTKNEMTAFRNDQGPGSEILLRELAQVAGEKYSPLSDVNRELIIRFILGDDRVVFFGRPVTGPPGKKKG